MKKNKKTEKEDPFADTLQVRRICSGDTELRKAPTREITKKRDKSNINTKLPDYERRQIDTNLNKTGLKVFLPDSKRGAPEKMNIRRQLRKAQLGSEIKMISVDLPRFGTGRAVISSKIKRETDHGENLNLESDKTANQNTNELDYNQPANLLEAARKEIDISQNQLEKIQTILKNRNSEDSYSLKTKWNSFPPKITSKVNSKERVISTLTTLNKKLNEMQEKYFSNNNSSYKSIRDISSKMRTQSISEVDVTRSDSDNSVQIEDKGKLLEKLHLSRMHLLPKQFSEEKGTSVLQDTGDYEDYLAIKQFYAPTEKKAVIDVTESNSDCVLPIEVRNNMLEKLNLARIERINDDSQGCQYPNKNSRKFSDKGQNFSTTIPDMILKGNGSMSDFNQSPVGNFERDSFSDLFNDSSEIAFLKKSECNDTSYEGCGESNYPSREVERLRELLLTQDRKSTEIMKTEKSLNFVIPRESKTLSSKERVSTTSGKLSAEPTEVNTLRSKSSEHPYFDCISKSGNPSLTSNSSTKKVFYDNFGRYSNVFDDKKSKTSAGNSVPNLSSSRFNSCETMTRSGQGIFDNTPLQNDVLKSEYLTKNFTVDSSGNFSESPSNQITKNKSDQFFNGGLNFKHLETKNIKGSKITKDMYMSLSKALSNSFYELPSQK